MSNLPQSRHTWYLLLKVGVPTGISGFNPTHHFRIARRECKPLGVTDVRELDVVAHTDSTQCSPRYSFRFPRYARNDEAAVRLAESFIYGISLLGGPLVDPHDDSPVMHVSDALISGGESVLLGDLVRREKSKPNDDRMVTYPTRTIGETTSTAANVHEGAWRVARVTFGDDRLFDATRFLSQSYLNFHVYPGQLREVAGDPDASARTGSEQTHFEEALQNAFKAVEAVIGDPPKDDRKLFLKLSALGIDPSEPAGYVAQRPFSEHIRQMNLARDKRAAHGSTRNRRIRAAELLDYQGCADVIVTAAIEQVRGGPLIVGPPWGSSR